MKLSRMLPGCMRKKTQFLNVAKILCVQCLPEMMSMNDTRECTFFVCI